MLMSIDFERFFEQFLYDFFGTFPQDFLDNFCFSCTHILNKLKKSKNHPHE